MFLLKMQVCFDIHFKLIFVQILIELGGGAVKYEVDTGVRPALQQAGAFGESTGSKNEGSLGESMIFGIQ